MSVTIHFSLNASRRPALPRTLDPTIGDPRQRKQHVSISRVGSWERLQVSHREGDTEVHRNVKTSAIRKFELIYHVLEKDIKLLAEPHFTRLSNTQLLAEDLVYNETEAYAQKCCPELCTAVQRTLPRELRDHMYDHILTPGPDDYPRNPLEIYKDALDTTDDGSYCDKIAFRVEADEDAHMCSHKFIDLDTMSEFARRWYTKVELHLCLTPAEVLTFFNTDIWGLGLGIDRLLRHVEVEVCEKEDEDNVTPLQQCLFKLASGASVVFHLRIEFIVGKGEQLYDEEYTMFLLSERVSELCPLIRQLIEADYELYGALDAYEDFRITPATLDREIWKDTLMEHCEGRDCG